MITLGTLCTGIGLIDLGLERAGLGPVKWQCEVLPERRAVLEKQWPDVRRYEDVRTLRVVHGGADRLDGARQRISALGDLCTPQQAEVIGHIVMLLERALALPAYA